MARASFGGGVSDYVVAATASNDPRVRFAPATLTFWDAETGGTQHTDLLLDGDPVTSITVGDDGQIPTFQGPDGVVAMWAEGPGGSRRMVDAGADIAALALAAAAEAETARLAAVAAQEAAEAVPVTDDAIVAGLVPATSGSATAVALAAEIDGRVPAASTTAQGKVELATNTETTTGTDAARATTPAGVKTVLDPIRNLSDTTLAGALAASYAPINQPALAEVKGKLLLGLGATLLFLSDSTGNDSIEWIHRFAEWLAARFPAVTVRYFLYDYVTATGTLTNGSATVSSVTVTGGAFAVGQTIQAPFIPAGTTITAIGSGTLTLSANAVIPSGVGTTFAASLVATLDAYGTAEVIQTGTGTGNAGGPYVVDIYNYAIPGGNTFHVLGFGTWTTKIVPTADAVFLSMGHNDGSGGAVPPNAWWDDLAACTESIRLTLPSAALCVVAQNPRTTDSDMTLRRFETIRWCRERGYGFIDVWRAFYDASGQLTTLSTLLKVDGIHPAGDANDPTSGQGVWLTEFERHWRSAPTSIDVPSLKASSFQTPGASILANGDFSTVCGRIAVSATLTNGSPTVTVTSTTGLYVGAYITGGLVPADTQIKSIDSSTQITMNRNATGSSGASSITQLAGFPYWNPVNLSADGTNLGLGKDIVNYESLPPLSGGTSPAGGWSARLQSLAAGQAFIKQTVPIRLCAGKWITFTARTRRNSDYGQRARPRIFQIGGTNAGGNFANAQQGFDSQWVYVVVKRFIPADATSLQVEFYAAATVSDNGADVNVDRCSLVIGQTPADVRRALVA